MGLFDLFRTPNINDGVKQFRETPGAVLLDVRTPAEYADGHIPGSRNLPAGQMGGIARYASDPDTPLFVYCLSGARSSGAVQQLRRMGYTNVTNIGGISRYQGKVER